MGVLARVGLLALLLAAGFWLRTLQPLSLGAVGWPWASAATVTLYFSAGDVLFPLSRRVPRDTDLPRAAAEALIAGPPAGSSLKSPLPDGTVLRSVRVENGTVYVDLSGPTDAWRTEPLAATALVATMRRLPAIRAVALTVEGTPITAPVPRAPLLYYSSSAGLVAVPIADGSPRAALEAFLSGPPSPDLTGMPADVRLLAYDFDEREGRLSLEFSYTPAVRTLALERPDRMRFLLLGLIASLTDFPEVQAVQLDFGGQTRLGLGECSDLLRTPQPRPVLLNDERLFDW